jgi:hypothetical protein
MSCPSSKSRKRSLVSSESLDALMPRSDGELAENLSALRDDVLLEERAAPDEKLRPVFVDGRASGR